MGFFTIVGIIVSILIGGCLGLIIIYYAIDYICSGIRRLIQKLVVIYKWYIEKKVLEKIEITHITRPGSANQFTWLFDMLDPNYYITYEKYYRKRTKDDIINFNRVTKEKRIVEYDKVGI